MTLVRSSTSPAASSVFPTGVRRGLNAVVVMLMLMNVGVIGWLIAGRPAQVPSNAPIAPRVFPGWWQTREATADQWWSVHPELPLGANLYLNNVPQDSGLFVFAEPKAAFTGANVRYQQLPECSALLREILIDSIPNDSQAQSRELSIGGLPAIQTEIRGLSQGVDLTFLHTVVETDDTFYCQSL